MTRLDLDLTAPGGALSEPAAVTIGNFDGVHLGHQRLVGETVSRAAEQALRPVALTFDPHPARVTHPDAAPACLMPVEERAQALGSLGIDPVVVLRFTPDVAALSWDVFCDRVLVRLLQARLVVVGDAFRFGHGRAGDVAALREHGARRGYAVVAVAPLIVAGEAVSSSRVRDLVRAGRVDEATSLLGRSYVVRGTVVHGDARGRAIGVPTANLDTKAEVVPRDGVYAARVTCDGYGVTEWPAVVNVGRRPTFDGAQRSIEAHLLSWDGQIHGAPMALGFAARLRDEARFESVEALVAQIRDDARRAAEVLEVPPGSRYSRESMASTHRGSNRS